MSKFQFDDQILSACRFMIDSIQHFLLKSVIFIK
jgi:hypothetical protein